MLSRSLAHSEIYCRGELLHTVQTAKLFNDSKTFVDMKLKQPPQKTLDAFKEFMSDHDNNPPKDDIRKFVQVSISLWHGRSSVEPRSVQRKIAFV